MRIAVGDHPTAQNEIWRPEILQTTIQVCPRVGIECKCSVTHCRQYKKATQCLSAAIPLPEEFSPFIHTLESGFNKPAVWNATRRMQDVKRHAGHSLLSLGDGGNSSGRSTPRCPAVGRRFEHFLCRLWVRDRQGCAFVLGQKVASFLSASSV